MIDRDRPLDSDIQFVAQQDKVLHRAHVNVGRFVPQLIQGFGHRHSAPDQQVQPNLPASDIAGLACAAFSFFEDNGEKLDLYRQTLYYLCGLFVHLPALGDGGRGSYMGPFVPI